MGILAIIGAVVYSPASLVGGGIPGGSELLMESGDTLLLESGDAILLEG